MEEHIQGQTAGVVVLMMIVVPLVIKILWDWLKRDPPRRERLDEVTVTFGDLKLHCGTAQESCMKRMLERLERGDARFERLDETLRGHEQTMGEISEKMSEMIRSNGKAEALGPMIQELTKEIAALRRDPPRQDGPVDDAGKPPPRSGGGARGK